MAKTLASGALTEDSVSIRDLLSHLQSVIFSKSQKPDPHTYTEPLTDQTQPGLANSREDEGDVVGWDNDAGGIFRTRAAKVEGDQKGWDDSNAW